MGTMIQATITYKCHVCGSDNIVKNGTNKVGSTQYHCKGCGVHRVLKPKQDTWQVLCTCQEQASWRGLDRIFLRGNHELVMRWLIIQYNLEVRPSLTR